MSDPERPEPAVRKGGFQPGNKFGKGRPKGAENKFGPNLREKLLAGIARSGEKKAKKAGINHKVDGVEFFIEALVENTAAASALLSKLIPAEQPPEASGGPGIIVNVNSIASGQQFAPGNEVLMPFEMATEAWKAFNGGAEIWATYLQSVEGQLTRVAFENLSSVPALSRDVLAARETPLLQLVRPEPTRTELLSPTEELTSLIARLHTVSDDDGDAKLQLVADLNSLLARLRLAAGDDNHDASMLTELSSLITQMDREIACELGRPPNGDDVA